MRMKCFLKGHKWGGWQIPLDMPSIAERFCQNPKCGCKEVEVLGNFSEYKQKILLADLKYRIK